MIFLGITSPNINLLVLHSEMNYHQGYFYVDLVGIKGILTEQKESAPLSPFSGLLLVRNSVRFLASLDPCQRFLTEKHHYVGRNTIIFGVYWPF